jgi:uncharacterized protein (DUF1800 family)
VPASDPLGERDAWHLLRRAGFGAHRKEVRRFAARSRAEAVDALLATKPRAVSGPGAYSFGRRELERLQVWWLRRMAAPRDRLREKMALFWHDHFPTSASLVHRLDAMAEQNTMFRVHGLGPFRELLHQVTRNRAMLEYLDGCRNRSGAVNENYGRELMELFALGPRDDDGQANFEQRDVRAVARSLTGFNFASVKKPVVSVAANRFDAGTKLLFLGRSFERGGNLGVEREDGSLFPPETNVLDALFAHRDGEGRPTLARFLVRKLWAWFATPDVEETLLAELSDAFVASGYELSALLRALLTHDAFYAEEARYATTKLPVEFVLQALLALGVKVRWQGLPPFLARMGMELFEPPGVEGWQHGPAWLATSRYLGRMALAQAIASGRSGKDGFRFRPPRRAGDTPAAVVDGALLQLGLELSPATRQQLIDYVSGDEFGSESWFERKLRGLYALLLSLPEFQVH